MQRNGHAPGSCTSTPPPATPAADMPATPAAGLHSPAARAPGPAEPRRDGGILRILYCYSKAGAHGERKTCPSVVWWLLRVRTTSWRSVPRSLYNHFRGDPDERPVGPLYKVSRRGPWPSQFAPNQQRQASFPNQTSSWQLARSLLPLIDRPPWPALRYVHVQCSVAAAVHVIQFCVQCSAKLPMQLLPSHLCCTSRRWCST
jgi:hypothetical protein